MAIKTILVKLTVDTDTLDKIESDYKGDYQNQIRSALGWAEESGVSVVELNVDPLAEFMDREVEFRLQEFFDIKNPTPEQIAAVRDMMDDTTNWIDYDKLDCHIYEVLQELEDKKKNN